MATSKATLTEPGRIIFGLMIATVVFSVVGEEVTGKAKVNPFKIILGGTIATSLLILVSHAGDAGEQFGVGLSVIAFTSSALVYGAPVWKAANSAFGSKPTSSTTATTPSTPTTTPTATAAALAQTIPIGG